MKLFHTDLITSPDEHLQEDSTQYALPLSGQNLQSCSLCDSNSYVITYELKDKSCDKNPLSIQEWQVKYDEHCFAFFNL